ncbi:hypothetical protein SUGI_1494730 [Cryptomeria japonica]|uniref:Uncharacterized protein n=1 Tax=Cryptomeria japonica TaxID=3369 RepID=A0AAD3RRP0_CRYJA|nr:hypothetical protein SUGI_1494730 [Cryptomeria japonica]
MEMEKHNQGREKRNRNLSFILFVTSSLARLEGFDLGKYVWEEEGNDWGLVHGELWIPNDMRLMEEIAAREAHVDYGRDCPMVTQVLATSKVYESIPSSSDKLQFSFWNHSSIEFATLFAAVMHPVIFNAKDIWNLRIHTASSTTASYPFLQFDLCNTVDVWQIYSQISMQENAHKTIALSVHCRDMGFSRIRWNLLITHMP